jgi:hypothetical protein
MPLKVGDASYYIWTSFMLRPPPSDLSERDYGEVVLYCVCKQAIGAKQDVSTIP